MVIRSLFMIISIMLGMALGIKFGTGSLVYPFLGASLMLTFSLMLIWLEHRIIPLRPVETLGGLAGFSFGLCLSGITSVISQQIFLFSPEVAPPVTFATLIVFCYMGTTLGLRISTTLFLKPISHPTDQTALAATSKILDTSAIIDGRIADLCQTGFVDGPLLVPQFVLSELQRIADSSDSHRRIRGKRGLDVLQELMRLDGIEVVIVETDYPHIPDVDSKLVELAKHRQAKIVTTDMNLNKVASVQGLHILNTNELSNAIRPVVLPGEALRVFLVREGKEAGQGVAHLDDGTMVVVDHARRWIGKHVEVVVTSIIQTNAGRMIFSSIRQNTPQLEASCA